MRTSWPTKILWSCWGEQRYRRSIEPVTGPTTTTNSLNAHALLSHCYRPMLSLSLSLNLTFSPTLSHTDHHSTIPHARTHTNQQPQQQQQHHSHTHTHAHTHNATQTYKNENLYNILFSGSSGGRRRTHRKKKKKFVRFLVSVRCASNK